MRNYLVEELTRIHPCWQATANASDGASAVKLLIEDSFDLVLTDIKMPGMDGLELAEYVERSCPCTYVIILSGYDEFDYARRAFRSNVYDYLLKPLQESELYAVLDKLRQKLDAARKANPGSFMLCPDSASKLVRNVCTYLEERFHEGISLAMIAEHFAVTPSYLSTVFRKETSLSYSKYVLQLRMQTAARLLREDKEMRIYEVAQACGFPSHKHFMYVFKNYFGMPPNEYRRNPQC